MNEEKNWKYRICPYLGQRSDSETALSYPSEVNCCFHAKPVAAIHFGHQEEFCLTSRYPNCKEYATEPDAALPAALHDSSGSRSRKRGGNNKWVLGIVMLGLVIIVAWQLIIRGAGFGQHSGGPTGSTESTVTSTGLSSTFLSPTTTPTPTPILVDTATSRPSLGLEIPLGIDRKFLIHQIQEGDSVDRIAGEHGTTVEALRALNYRLPSPLLPGWAIVVPLDFIDTQGIPAFEVYSVTEEISLEDLAIRLSVDLDQMKYYNALGDNFIPMAGDWLLIPRAGSPTP